ncbi:MAG: methyltransferase domain-containing protein [Bryobacteraceae bacterium]|nr:methyltransferase domain-containing protein [Bryobacteraceae bacterium]
MPIADPIEIRKKIAQVPWYHQFEIAPGIRTPGVHRFDPAPFLDGWNIPQDLRGQRALDIGTWDGPLAFELERRGAEVIAADIQDPLHTGFSTAKEILGSRVEYVRTSVYDLEKSVCGRFDLVCYLGVFYHLKHPILGFEAIQAVMADSASLLFEGACLLNYAERMDGLRVEGTELDAVRKLAYSDVPLTACYPGKYTNASNWFIPNLACIRSWLTAAGLSLEHHYLMDGPERDPFPLHRVAGIAKKVRPTAVEEHPLV